MQKYTYNEDFFKEDTESVFYWAGYIAADGCVRIHTTKYSKSPTLELVSVDGDHIVKFLSHINCKSKNNDDILPFYTRIVGNSKINKIYLTSKSIFNDLGNRFNIHPNKTKTHEFPIHLKKHPLMRHFLRGYFDGDGGVYLNKSRKNFQMTARICGTLEFLQEYKEVLESGSNFLSISKPYIHNGQGALNYGGNIQMIKIRDYLYNNASIFMERKYNQFLEIPQHDHLNLTVNYFKEVYLKTNSYTRAGKEIGCSVAYLKLFAKKHNLIDFCNEHKKNLKVEKRKKPTKEELEAAFDELKSITKVAHRFNYSIDSIYNFVKQYQIKR